VTRFAPVYRALGMIIMLFGLTMLAPLILSYVYNDGAQTAYDEALGLTMLSGPSCGTATGTASAS
jgi:trk system potassium uptake protein TrkH